MNAKNKQLKTMLLLIVLLMVGLIVVNSCKKSEPAAPPEPSPPATEPEETADVIIKQVTPPEPTPTPEKPKEITDVTIEQTTCPVMAGPINKDIFIEFKGKKVYFCCEGCKAKFEAEPEKYLVNLPQFKSSTEIIR